VTGFGAPPRSFGRSREDDKGELPLVVVPPLQLTSVQVPLVLVVDQEALQVVAAQIQQMVCSAVLAGFGEAMGQVGVASMEAQSEFGEHFHL
jgi:hypothetical protein